jgi:NAD(P)-dependent dehydrogenase (short-subunit alcohol dehydrogenase family)
MNNKVALVTGGSSGIGKATAIALAKAGAKVAIASRKKSTAYKALKEIEREGTEVIWIGTLVRLHKLRLWFRKPCHILDV